MFVKIDDIVLNVDQIKIINVDPQGKYVVVYFSDEFTRKFTFPNYESQNRFLEKIGLKAHFA